jgi:hypothetical protein
MERLPLSWWHFKARSIIGTATLFDAFAVRSLERCRHERGAVARHIVALSTFSVMGTSPTRIGVCKRHQSLCGRL